MKNINKNDDKKINIKKIMNNKTTNNNLINRIFDSKIQFYTEEGQLKKK